MGKSFTHQKDRKKGELRSDTYTTYRHVYVDAFLVCCNPWFLLGIAGVIRSKSRVEFS